WQGVRRCAADRGGTHLRSSCRGDRPRRGGRASLRDGAPQPDAGLARIRQGRGRAVHRAGPAPARKDEQEGQGESGTKDEDIAGIARSWWKTFMEPETGEARATRARLRRAHGWQQAMLEPAAIVLARRLGVTEHERRLRMALGLASVLAHVKEN